MNAYTHGYFRVCAGSGFQLQPEFFNGIFGWLRERIARRSAIRAAARERIALVVYKGDLPIALYDGYRDSPWISTLEQKTGLASIKVTVGA